MEQSDNPLTRSSRVWRWIGVAVMLASGYCFCWVMGYTIGQIIIEWKGI